jgi:hypothetical protein
MIVNDLDLSSVAFRKFEAHSPLLINANAPLTSTIAPQRFKTIRRGLPQICDFGRSIELRKPHDRTRPNFRRKPLRSAGDVEKLGLAACERRNHTVKDKLFVYLSQGS